MQTLASHIVRAEGLPAVAAVGWIIRLAKTLEPIHELGVAHGCITADAILSDGPAPGTRGLILVPKKLREQAAFHSAERAAGEGASAEDDTWAAAVLLFFALTNALPFPGTDDREVRRRILASPPAALATYTAGDDKLQEIMNRALSRSVLDRITSIAALREALESWHPHPAAKELPPLEHEGSLLLALAAGPTATPAPAPVSAPREPQHVLSGDVLRSLPRAEAAASARKAPPVVHEDAEPEEDEPTRVRDVPMLLQQLAILQKPDPSEPPKPIAAPPAEPLRKTPVAPPPEDASPAAVSTTSTTEGSSVGRVQLDTASSPVLPLVRDSVPGEVPVSTVEESSQARIELDRPSAPVLPFERESAPPAERPHTASASAAEPEPARPATAPSVRPPATPSVAPEPAPAAPQKKGLSVTTIALGVGAAAVAAGLAFFGLRANSSPQKDPGSASHAGQATTASAAPSETRHATSSAAVTASSAAVTASDTAPATTESATASAAVTASASATASASVSATATATAAASASATATATAAASATAAAPQAGVAACMVPLFATGTFLSPPSALDSACQITDPREGVKLLKLQVILASENKRTTDGMREWAIIGWYGMPAFELMRATCCASPPELKIPFKDPSCDMEGAVKRLAKAATNKTAEETEINDALKAYTKAVICTSNSGASGVFGQPGAIVEGELVTFQKTLARVRTAIQSK